MITGDSGRNAPYKRVKLNTASNKLDDWLLVRAFSSHLDFVQNVCAQGMAPIMVLKKPELDTRKLGN